ncbi:divalent-cation tolerance protein CutA [Vibrio aquimaris]|uniref:Divalent-cation tolerance protein CutA n=2 Tax=Vibrio aquimaris TaxID=2587862 RepID=A0A5P9CPQ0_9VIBR|nr:Divalent-cation tolerance protein CutA [Vibrio aquimaris]
MLKSAVCNRMKEELCIVLTTTDCQKTVQTIIEAALERELSACIQTLPIQSSYKWEGKLHQDSETLLIFKTQKVCYKKLEDLISSLHNYEVPEVIQLSISEGFSPYLTWLKESTRC